jgi:hypothetical protein
MERTLRHAKRHCFSSDLHDREPEQEKLKAILESKPSAIHLMLGKFFLIRISSATFSQVYHGPRSSKLWQIQADQIGVGNKEESCRIRLQRR